MPTCAVRKTSHHPSQISRRNKNIAVVDDHVFIARLAQHLHQVAHLARRSQSLATLHQPNRTLRKLRPKPLDLANSRIIKIAHTKDDLKATRILLPAMTRQTRIHPRIDAFHRLQNRYVGSETILQLPLEPVVSEASRSPQREQQISQPSKSQQCRDRLNCCGHPLSLPTAEAVQPATRNAMLRSGSGSQPSTPDRSRTKAQSHTN